jgi:hypothetical protein
MINKLLQKLEMCMNLIDGPDDIHLLYFQFYKSYYIIIYTYFE